MSALINGASTSIAATLGAALTIGAGAYNVATMVCRKGTITAEADLFFIGVDRAGTFPNCGLYFSATSNQLVGTYGSESTIGAYTLDLDTWYWAVMSRAGTGAGQARLRIWNMSGTKVHETTGTDGGTYSAMDNIWYGESGMGYPTANVEVCNGKVHTGTEWSDGEAWAEAQKWLIQKSGGTDRHAFRLAALNDSTAGLHSCTSSALLTNTGVVAGASRPSCLEYAPLASDDFNRANETPLASPWAKVPGGWPGETNLVSNRAEGSGADGPQYYTGVTWPDDQWSEFVLPDVIADWDAAIMVRLGSGSGYSWTGVASTGGPVNQMATGAFGTDIANRDPALASGNGDYVMRLEIQGTTLRCYKNGVQVGADVSATVHASGAPGFFSYYSGGAVTAWAGGRFGTPPTYDPPVLPFTKILFAA